MFFFVLFFCFPFVFEMTYIVLHRRRAIISVSWFKQQISGEKSDVRESLRRLVRGGSGGDDDDDDGCGSGGDDGRGGGVDG